MLRFIELKTGFSDNGPAWIGLVQMSKSGRTIYFNGKAFRRTTQGISGNYFDVETPREEYWISGVKKDGRDRHWAGSGKITIEAAAVDAYLEATGQVTLDAKRFVVSHSIVQTDPSRFHALANEPLE